MSINFKITCKMDPSTLSDLNVLNLTTIELLRLRTANETVELICSFEDDGSLNISHVNENRVIYNDYVETTDGLITNESKFQ